MDRDEEEEVEVEEVDIWVEHKLHTKADNTSLSQAIRNRMLTRILAHISLSSIRAYTRPSSLNDRSRANAVAVMSCWITSLGPTLGGTV